MTEQKILTRYGYIAAVRRARRRLRVWAWVLALLSLAAGIAAILLTGR
jgi:hypothetical protein